MQRHDGPSGQQPGVDDVLVADLVVGAGEGAAGVGAEDPVHAASPCSTIGCGCGQARASWGLMKGNGMVLMEVIPFSMGVRSEGRSEGESRSGAHRSRRGVPRVAG